MEWTKQKVNVGKILREVEVYPSMRLHWTNKELNEEKGEVQGGRIF